MPNKKNVELQSVNYYHGLVQAKTNFDLNILHNLYSLSFSNMYMTYLIKFRKPLDALNLKMFSKFLLTLPNTK